MSTLTRETTDDLLAMIDAELGETTHEHLCTVGSDDDLDVVDEDFSETATKVIRKRRKKSRANAMMTHTAYVPGVSAPGRPGQSNPYRIDSWRN